MDESKVKEAVDTCIKLPFKESFKWEVEIFKSAITYGPDKDNI